MIGTEAPASAEPVPLAHQTIGEGPPLLLLHGLLGSGTNWRSIARALAADFAVHLLDLRNHGASAHSARMDYETMAADVLAWMDEQSLESAAILGHSMGGKTAMCAALIAPERLVRLVVVDIAPVDSPGEHVPVIEAMRRTDLSSVSRRTDADAALAASITDPDLRAFVLQNLVMDGDGYRWRINLEAISTGLPALMRFPEFRPDTRYGGPCLFVHGARSNYVRKVHHAAIKKLFPSADVQAIADAGHWVHAEQPGAFLSKVRPFLASAVAR